MDKEVLKSFSDADFGLEDKDMSNAKKRTIVRGIVVDQAGNVAVFNKRVANEYKLPGGVVKDNESTEDTFLKEIKREIGCEIEIIEDIGIIEERMSQDEVVQETYVYVGRVLEKGKIDYQNQEIDNSEIENIYHTKFSVYRDEFITRYYLIKYIY